MVADELKVERMSLTWSATCTRTHQLMVYPTDDATRGITAIMNEPWGKKSVRIAIGIGSDVDDSILQRFIGHSEIKPLRANNADQLVTFY